MSRHATRLLLFALATAVALTLAIAWQRLQTPPAPTDAHSATLRAATRAEPLTFNRLVAHDLASLAVSRLTQASLVRIDHATQALEPYLATSWRTDADGRRVTLTLHEQARFSDGTPVTADDVVFSFAAVYDSRVGSPLAASLRIDGTPIGVRALDTHTVELTYPAPHGPGLRPLHVLPILPRHRLEARLAEGTFDKAWAVGTPPSEVIGAGPFVLERHEPGVALHFVRTPAPWERDDDGALLPRVGRVELRLVPSQDAEMVQLSAGTLDITTAELRPEDVPEARRLEAEGVLQVFDLGAALTADFLWFNLAPDAAAADRPWLQARALREAIAHAVDREAFVDAVYQGSGLPVSGLITSGNKAWHSPDVGTRAYAPDRAVTLLESLNLLDRDGDGVREDTEGRPARFPVLVQQGHTSRQRAMTVLQEMLRPIGLHLDIVSLDAQAIFGRWQAGDYDAIYHALPATDTDPAGLGVFWLSSGSLHMWHPEQASPATPWEAEIDRLFRAQLTTVDQEERRRLMAEAQRIFDREVPALFFAAPTVHVAVSGRLTGVRPGLLAPPVLWNAAEIGVR